MYRIMTVKYKNGKHRRVLTILPLSPRIIALVDVFQQIKNNQTPSNEGCRGHSLKQNQLVYRCGSYLSVKYCLY